MNVTTAQFIRDNYWTGLVGVGLPSVGGFLEAFGFWGYLATPSQLGSERQINLIKMEPLEVNAARFTYRFYGISAQLNSGILTG